MTSPNPAACTGPSDSATETCEVLVQRLAHAEGLELPHSASSGSAGFDLRAAVTDSITLEPGQRALVPTGLVIAIPEGWEGQVRPRSGLALRHGVTLVNSPGTIDSDYRGEVGVIVINHGQEPFVVERGDRIAQLLLARTVRLRFRESTSLSTIDPSNTRGRGGFGSSGRN
jgi:dUTP pyrophosphatase